MINKGELIDNRYKIIKSIGEGGMANVYLAWDTILEREVAVKILRGDLSDDEKFIRRFQREALSASSLSHPNIVSIYDVGNEGDINYIVMECLEGKTLKDYIEEHGKLSSVATLKFASQIASALEAAHKAKIIHRDIKPENIFVDAEGNFKLGDFGVAKQMEKTQGSMSVKGTYNYMSPEVFSVKKSDGRADMYSLALVMYKLLNNDRLPFLDPDKQLIRYNERQAAFEKRIKGEQIPDIKGVSKDLNDE